MNTVDSLAFAQSQIIEEVKQEPTFIVDEPHPDSIVGTQDAIMSTMKQGVVSMMAGLKSVKDKAVSATPEEVKENIELSKNIAM